MRRKSIRDLRRIYGNEEDRDTAIAILLKRTCSTDQIIEYLLSAVLDQAKDDILGELVTQYEHMKTPSQ